MPKCKNDPSRSYKGIEPSPKGLGYCAHAEKLQSKKKGKDGNIWIVKAVKKSKRWFKFSKEVVSKKKTNKLYVVAPQDYSRIRVLDEKSEEIIGTYFAPAGNTEGSWYITKKINKNDYAVTGTGNDAWYVVTTFAKKVIPKEYSIIMGGYKAPPGFRILKMKDIYNIMPYYYPLMYGGELFVVQPPTYKKVTFLDDKSTSIINGDFIGKSYNNSTKKYNKNNDAVTSDSSKPWYVITTFAKKVIPTEYSKMMRNYKEPPGFRILKMKDIYRINKNYISYLHK